MESLWINTAKPPRFEPLSGDVKTDVLIVGGGMAGVLCAYKLHTAGVDYRLVEAKTIGSGITKDTTAKLTVQHGLLYHKLIRQQGLAAARAYLEAQQNALDEYRALCRVIDCDYTEQLSSVYTLNDRQKLEQELAALKRLDYPATLQNPPLPFPTAGAVALPGQAQFHPLTFLYAIAHGLHIHEHTKVLELKPGGAITNRGKITAKKILIATHFPMLNKHGGYFLKLYQHRSYVLALEGDATIEGMYVDEANAGLSFRRYGDLLLLGGGGHRTGKYSVGWQGLETFAALHYPKARIAYRWATQDCMTLAGIPYIGQYSKSTPHLYVATGFNKWGMTNAMAAAQILSKTMLEQEHPQAWVFSPTRRVLRTQLAINAAESLVGLLTPTTPRCPHMGCALKYNPQEHTWDCPCHGSRFTEDGRLIDNPATDDKGNCLP